MNNRRFVQVVVGGTAAVLVLAAGATVVLDPFFHTTNLWKEWSTRWKTGWNAISMTEL